MMIYAGRVGDHHALWGWRVARLIPQSSLPPGIRKCERARRGYTGPHQSRRAAGSRLQIHLPHPSRCHGSSRGAVHNLSAVEPASVYSVTITEEA